MRSFNEAELRSIEFFTGNSIELCFIEPTHTGLTKSILDATGSVRAYLKKRGIHDYNGQLQGVESKKEVKVFYMESDGMHPSLATLYRPRTKKGDPRLWFKRLGSYAKPGDILGIVEFESVLYIFNLSRIDVVYLFGTSRPNPVKDLIHTMSEQNGGVAKELLSMLDRIAKLGPVSSQINADTSVGRTLEGLLGISTNSSKQPDYKGIEIKSFRDARKNRKNLFAQVPDWSLSKMKSSKEILDAFGYDRTSEFRLYCTVSSLGRNSQGLQLRVDDVLQWLVEGSDNPMIGEFAVWPMSLLHSRLMEKHNETFWVSAESIMIDGIEHFLFNKVEHTRQPIIGQFDVLLSQGLITLDHLIKRRSDGGVVEKGPFFKIRANALGLLFPPSRIYDLSVDLQ